MDAHPRHRRAGRHDIAGRKQVKRRLLRGIAGFLLALERHLLLVGLADQVEMEIEVRHVVDMRWRMTGRFPVDDDMVDDRSGTPRWHGKEEGDVGRRARHGSRQALEYGRGELHADRRQLAVHVGADDRVRGAVANGHDRALVGRGLGQSHGRSMGEHGHQCGRNEGDGDPPSTAEHALSPVEAGCGRRRTITAARGTTFQRPPSGSSVT